MAFIVQHKRFYAWACALLLAFLVIVKPASAFDMSGYGKAIPAAAPNTPIPLRGSPLSTGIGLAIGLGLWYLEVQGTDALHSLQIQAGASNHADLPHPLGWTDADHPPNPGTLHPSGSVVYGLGGTLTPSSPYYIYAPTGAYYSTPDAAAAAYNFCAGRGTLTGTYISPPSGWGAHCTGGDAGGGSYGVLAPHCDSGYSLSGSTCTLTDSPYVTWDPDSIPTETQTGATYQAAARDPDANSIGTKSAITSSGIDEAGRPTQTTITPHADGSVTVRTQTQYTDAAGNTAVNDYTIEIGTDGKITNITNANTSGTGLSGYTGPATTSTGSGAPSITLPTDYAREATLATTNSKVQATNDKLDTISSKLDVNGDPATAAETAITDGTSDIENKLSIGPSGVNVEPFDPTAKSTLLPSMFSAVPDGGSCVDPTLNIAGHTGTIELCRFWEPWRDGIGWLLWVLTGVYLWRRVSGIETG